MSPGRRSWRSSPGPALPASHLRATDCAALARAGAGAPRLSAGTAGSGCSGCSGCSGFLLLPKPSQQQLGRSDGVVCVWFFISLAGVPPHSGFLALKRREERQNYDYPYIYCVINCISNGLSLICRDGKFKTADRRR